MSPSRPTIGVATEALSRYAVRIQVAPVVVVCRSSWMSRQRRRDQRLQQGERRARHGQDHEREAVVWAVRGVRHRWVTVAAVPEPTAARRSCHNPVMTLTQSDRPAPHPRLDSTRLRAVGSSRGAAPATAAALVVASTAVVALVTPTVPSDAAGVIYLVGVLGVSSLYGLWWGLITSLVSALAFNFFFLPPAHTLVINSSSDWAALAAFALTALVTCEPGLARARRERDEAARRAAEARAQRVVCHADRGRRRHGRGAADAGQPGVARAGRARRRHPPRHPVAAGAPRLGADARASTAAGWASCA